MRLGVGHGGEAVVPEDRHMFTEGATELPVEVRALIVRRVAHHSPFIPKGTLPFSGKVDLKLHTKTRLQVDRIGSGRLSGQGPGCDDQQEGCKLLLHACHPLFNGRDP